jgi:tetrahydromethanopterin S-methyltransferase subunit E
MEGPVIISAAIFVSIIFLDLFRHNYKAIPAHAVLGIFSIVLMTFLCETNLQFFAWIVLFIPFIVLIVAIMIRQRNMMKGREYPVAPIQKAQPRCQPAPYYM